jgi:hypothetical protein
VTGCFSVASHKIPGGTEENHGKLGRDNPNPIRVSNHRPTTFGHVVTAPVGLQT